MDGTTREVSTLAGSGQTAFGEGGFKDGASDFPSDSGESRLVRANASGAPVHFMFSTPHTYALPLCLCLDAMTKSF